MATMMAMAMAKTFTPAQVKTLLEATLIGPTARLSTEESLRRVEELRQRSHHSLRRADNREARPARTNVPVADKRHRQPEFVVFARYWSRYMVREGGSTID